MIFMETGAWYAACVPTDTDYLAARAWLANNQEPLLTTDYFVDDGSIDHAIGLFLTTTGGSSVMVH